MSQFQMHTGIQVSHLSDSNKTTVCRVDEYHVGREVLFNQTLSIRFCAILQWSRCHGRRCHYLAHTVAVISLQPLLPQATKEVLGRWISQVVPFSWEYSQGTPLMIFAWNLGPYVHPYFEEPWSLVFFLKSLGLGLG